MKHFNVVIWWTQDDTLEIAPTSLNCDNLIPLRAFCNREITCKLYTTNEAQEFHLREFPLEPIAKFLISTAEWRTKNARKVKARS